MSIFSDNFKELRTKRGISQDDLAAYLGKTRASISNYENGKTQPEFEDLIKIADLFNVTTDYMLGRENAEKHYTDKKPDDVQERFFNQLKALIMSNSEKVTEEELKHIAEFSNYIVTRDRQK